MPRNRYGGAEERPRIVAPHHGPQLPEAPLIERNEDGDDENGGIGEAIPRHRHQHLPTGQDIFKLGLSLVGFPDFRQRVSDDVNDRRFRAFFGIGPIAIAALFKDVSSISPSIDLAKLLMTINWLKLYDTEPVMSGRWGMSEQSIRNIVKQYTGRVQELKATKIQMGGFDNDEIFIISIDGVHCRIQEVRKDPSAKWYSHKFHGAGLSYELGIAVRSNRLVWINGPFHASRHDISIFRNEDDPENGLMSKIPDGKRAIGDSGYKGEPAKITITKAGDSREVKRFKGRVKSRHETFNARLKCFSVLAIPFRHGFELHKQVFEAVCLCIQYDIENGNGLFEV